MIWDFLQVFTKVRNTQKLYADDGIDKLNRSLTVILLIIAAIFIGSRSFGAPILCLEQNIKQAPIGLDYVNAVCWVKDTLKLDHFFYSAIRNKTSETKINSYPWMMLISLTMALIFYLPYLLWKLMVRKNTYQNIPIDINSIVSLLKNSSLHRKDDFAKNITTVSDYLDRCFSLNNFNDGYLDEHDDFSNNLINSDIKSNNPKSINKDPKTYKDRVKKRKISFFHVPLIMKYLFIKLVYLAISIGIFYLIDILFQFNQPYYKFGQQIFNKYSSTNQTQRDYISTLYFPEHVLCDIKYMDIKNVQTYTYHCSLPANVFNEKLFLVLWFWFIVLVVFNTFSLIKWILKLMFRKQIIKNMLLWPFTYNYHIDKYINSFVYDYLSTEGFLMIMLIKANTQDWHCRSIVRCLWKFYMTRSRDEANRTEFPLTEEDQDVNMFSSATSTAKQTGRREYNFDRNLHNSTPVKANLSKIAPSDKECKNNYKLNEEFIKLKNHGDMV